MKWWNFVSAGMGIAAFGALTTGILLAVAPLFAGYGVAVTAIGAAFALFGGGIYFAGRG